jgi:gamma-glutamylcyclotransferase
MRHSAWPQSIVRAFIRASFAQVAAQAVHPTESTPLVQTIFYFAYGSNMAIQRFKARVPSGETVGVAVLDGYQLAFHKRSFDGSAKCDVIETRAKEDRVYGVVYEISADELPRLDLVEGKGFGYERRSVRVTAQGGAPIFAECYFATDIGAETAPYSWYLYHVLTGAQQERLPAWYIAQIASVACKPDLDTQRSARELAIYANEDA